MRAYRYLALAGLFTVTACTTDPYTGEQKASNAALYGVGGAAVCGILGSMKNNKTGRRAALGCGVLGTGVGAYMDAQEKQLREQVAGYFLPRQCYRRQYGGCVD